MYSEQLKEELENSSSYWTSKNALLVKMHNKEQVMAQLADQPTSPIDAVIGDILQKNKQLQEMIETYAMDKQRQRQRQKAFEVEHLSPCFVSIAHAQAQLEAKIEARFFWISKAFGVPMSRERSAPEAAAFWGSQEEVLKEATPEAAIARSGFPSWQSPAPCARMWLSESSDLLAAVSSLAVARPSLHPAGLYVPGMWSCCNLPIKTASLETLRHRFRSLHPRNRHVGVDDELVQDADHAFINQKRAQGNELLQMRSSRLARDYATHGVPASLRSRIWTLCLEGSPLDPDNSLTKRTILKLQAAVSRTDLLLDRIIHIDVKNCQNNDNYFVFEDVLREVMLLWSRDPWIRDNLGDSAEIPNTINGVLPIWGVSLYAMPVCYIAQDSGGAYMIFRQLYSRYFHRLFHLSDRAGSLIDLCIHFENLLKQKDSRLYHYLSDTMGIHPLEIAFKWILFAFVGIFEVDQVLALWDRVVGFDSTVLIAATAAALIVFRTDEIMSCKTVAQIKVLVANKDSFNELTQIKVIPLLQQFLFVI